MKWHLFFPDTVYNLFRPLTIFHSKSWCSIFVPRPAAETLVHAKCRRLTRLLMSDVRAHDSTASVAALATRHILKRIHFRLCVLAYQCVHSTAPAYLADSLRLTSEVAARRCLCSVDSPTMMVPSTRRSTLSDRAFPVAAVWAWNSLPPQTRAGSLLLTFPWETKSHLFRQSFGWWKSGTVPADWQLNCQSKTCNL